MSWSKDKLAQKLKFSSQILVERVPGVNLIFASHGIHHRRSCSHTHEQSGMAERKIIHIVDIGLTILTHRKIPLSFWNFAFSTVVYTMNHIPSKTHELHQSKNC